jgi:hypothetical protein
MLRASNQFHVLKYNFIGEERKNSDWDWERTRSENLSQNPKSPMGIEMEPKAHPQPIQLLNIESEWR